MSEYDFRLLGSFIQRFLTKFEDGPMDQTVVEHLVWECQRCYSLTNSPEDHALNHGFKNRELRIER